MIIVRRHRENPILLPNKKNQWEAKAVFNGCVIKQKRKIHLVYRAISSSHAYSNLSVPISSIGYALSSDGVHFKRRRQFIKPEYEWEKFGCEDPRITRLDGKYFIFYTALSQYPPIAHGIRVGLAITKNFKKIKEKHLITFFNSKAMALFPEKINGKIAVILTANTDIPPAKIGIAFFNTESQLWSREYWEDWYASLDSHTITLKRTENDHVEIGAPPIKTKAGWLLLYCYIENYFYSNRTFGIEAVLLDLNNPFKIIGKTKKSLMVPEENYELYGNVENVIFPSGALIHGSKLLIYYGAADTTCCLAICDLKNLIRTLLTS